MVKTTVAAVNANAVLRIMRSWTLLAAFGGSYAPIINPRAHAQRRVIVVGRFVGRSVGLSVGQSVSLCLCIVPTFSLVYNFRSPL